MSQESIDLTKDYEDYDLARYILRHPRVCFGEARTLRDVLALLHGVAVGRYPPHGCGFLPGFSDFVNRRFRAGRIAEYHTLIQEFGDRPFGEALKAILRLLEEWKASSHEDQDLR
jgi:hypothetical protein